MADENNCGHSPLQWAQAVALGIIMVLGAWNSRKIEDVKDTQGAQVQRAEKVQETLDTRTVEQDVQLAKIQKAQQAAQEAQSFQLLASWKYLDSVAEYDPTEENKAKAKEAKAAYDAALKKKP